MAGLSAPEVTPWTRKRPRSSVPSLDAVSPTPGAPQDVPGALIASDVLSDGTTTDDRPGAQSSQRERLLRPNRSSYRRRVYAVTAAEVADSGSQTFLETKAVTKRTRANYREVLARCRAWARAKGMRMRSDKEIDHALCLFMNAHYFRGFQSHLGETLMSAFIDSNPGFAKYGVRRTTRPGEQ